MNNNDLKNKCVYINGKNVITNWKEAKIFSPENNYDSIHVNESAENEIKKQTEILQENNKNIFSTSC